MQLQGLPFETEVAPVASCVPYVRRSNATHQKPLCRGLLVRLDGDFLKKIMAVTKNTQGQCRFEHGATLLDGAARQV